MLGAALVSQKHRDRWSVSPTSSRDQDEKKMDDDSSVSTVYVHNPKSPVGTMPTVTALTQRRPLIHQEELTLPEHEPSRVKFLEVCINYHALTVGVNPGSTDLGSPPMELDWKCLEQEKIPIDDFEESRQPVRRRVGLLRVASEQRRERLINDWNVPPQVLEASVRVADEIRRERAISYHSRPPEEVQALAERSRYAKEKRRLQMVKLRQEKYARQKAERKEQRKVEAQQKRESRRKTLRGLFGR